MVLTSGDGRRLFKQIATRAARVQTTAKKIKISADVKRPGTAQALRVNKLTQILLGDMRVILDVLASLSE